MYSPINLLFSFQGRIGRAQFWFGVLLLVILSFILLALANPELLNFEETELKPPTTAECFVMLALLVPALALTLKRLNDRNWPQWAFWIVVATSLPFYVGPFFGYLWNPELFVAWEWVVGAIGLVVSLWLLVDNGFLRGTEGPNAYGPDPLATD